MLVVASDDKTCYQLRHYLCEGGQSLLDKQLSRHIPAYTAKVKGQKRPLSKEVGVASTKPSADVDREIIEPE